MTLEPRAVRRVGTVLLVAALLGAAAGDVLGAVLVGLGAAVGVATPAWRDRTGAGRLAWWHLASLSLLLAWAGGVATLLRTGPPLAVLAVAVLASLAVVAPAADLAAGGRYVFPDLRAGDGRRSRRRGEEA